MVTTAATPTPSPRLIPVTPEQSLRRGLMWSASRGALAGFLAACAVDWISDYLATAVFIVVGGTLTLKLLYDGYDPKNAVALVHEGIGTGLGDQPTGESFQPGIHFRKKGIEGIIPVDKRVRKLVMESFIDLADDQMPVLIKPFIFVETIDSLRTFNVQEADEDLADQCDGQARLFTNQVKKAAEAIRLKDDLAEYLSLPPVSTDPHAHNRFRDKLLAAEQSGQLVRGAADTIMEEAGDLAELASQWGMRINEVRVKDFDLDPIFRAAQVEKTKQEALMAAKREQNTAAAAMVKELVDSGVDPNKAATTVDMRMGLPVQKTVQEKTVGFQNFDPNLVVTLLGKPIADAFARWINPSGEPKAPVSTEEPKTLVPKFTPRPINRPSRPTKR